MKKKPVAEPPKLEIKYVAPSALKLNDKNPRINDHAVDPVKGSMEHFKQAALGGFVEPIIARLSDNMIVCGHTRVKAALKMNTKEVPVVFVDFDEADAQLYGLGSNKLNELALWDIPGLDAVLDELRALDVDVSIAGFGDYDFGIAEGQTDPDDVPEIPEEPVTRMGDLWIMGNHRLECGDSTDAGAVALLMDGKNVALLCVDPPYGKNVIKRDTIGGCGAVGGKKNYKKTIGGDNIVKAHKYKPIKGDDEPFDPRFLLDYCEHQIIFGGNYFADKLPNSSGWFVWDKIDGMEGTTKNFSDFEMGWTNYDTPARLFRHRWQGLMKGSERDQKRCHPTQKPIALIVELLTYYDTGINDILDLYVGSGTTIIAAEQTGRSCFAMELEPIYCDVAVIRWQNFTGKQAHRDGDGVLFDDLKAGVPND